MLLDTSFIRLAIEKHPKARPVLERASDRHAISSLTVGEIFHATPEEDFSIITLFLKEFTIFNLTFDIALLAGKMLRARQEQISKRGGKKINKPVDYYIAATALYHDLSVLTHNFRDFKKIKKLPAFSALKVKEFKI